MDKIQNDMKPGKLTMDGFLGDDSRNLIDILAEDERTVKNLNLEHKDIATKMAEFRDKGLRGLGNFVAIDETFDVKVDSVRGKLPCPFKDPGIFSKTNITVRNKKKSKEITFTDLDIHMILKHGFYQGKPSKYRIEPEFLAEILWLT